MNYNKGLFLIIVLVAFSSCVNKIKNEEKQNVAAAVAITKLPYFDTTLFTPVWKKGTHKIPNFSFTNQIGGQITNKTYAGKIYVADFFFTICPGICPKLTKNMNMLQEAYQDDTTIMLLSHSVMPWHDTVAKLADYAVENNVNLPQWNLVTGDTDEIYEIARKGYFADEGFVKTQPKGNFIHTENFILVDHEGYIRGVYNGTLALEVKRLIRHIEILKKEL